MNPIIKKKDLETLINDIRNSAYSYLEKYNPSKQQLKIYLLKKSLNSINIPRNKKDLTNLIDEIVNTLEKRELINDKFYANSKAKKFFKRGYSLNKIRYSLIKKGVDEKFIKGSISEIEKEQSDPDFFSALKICKKRRIGPARAESNRNLFYKKDISFLARSGFSYDISKKILDLPKKEFEKLLNLA